MSERLRWKMPYLDAASIARVFDRAIQPDGAPLFVLVNLLDAHSPYNPPAAALESLGLAPGRSFDRYLSHRKLSERWSRLGEGSRQDLADLYDGELRFLDAHLERILRTIDERLGAESVVIVTADHGEELGEAGRVGHEWGLPQSVLHVPLLIRAPGIGTGETDELVSLRALHRLLAEVGRGGGVDLSVLVAPDGYGVVAERYPSGHNLPAIGEDALRPWVALFESDLKAVGPSVFGPETFDVGAGRFSADLPAPESEASVRMGARIDRYWQEEQDPRSPEDQSGVDGEEDFDMLRSLGYVQ